MDRPTKEAVDAALAHYYDEAGCSIERRCSAVLAAEVVALRLESVELRASNEEYAREVAELARTVVRVEAERDMVKKACGELSLAVARVEALPEKWRLGGNQLRAGEIMHDASTWADIVTGLDDADLRHASELEAALRGEP